MNRTAIRAVIAQNITSLLAGDEHPNAQTKLAEKAGIPSDTLSRILDQTLDTDIETLASLAEALNVSASDLLNPDLCRDPLHHYHARIAALPLDQQARITTHIDTVMAETRAKAA